MGQTLGDYISAIKSPQTKEKYVLRLGRFLDFIKLQGSIENKTKNFANKRKEDSEWAFNSVLNFRISLKERFDKKELAPGTIRNYVKSIKLFCTMSDIQIPWDKITRGLPRGDAEDRAPTLEEIKTLLEYPDRRIKAIISVMISSGFRVGAWDYLKWRHIIPIESLFRFCFYCNRSSANLNSAISFSTVIVSFSSLGYFNNISQACISDNIMSFLSLQRL